MISVIQSPVPRHFACQSLILISLLWSPLSLSGVLTQCPNISEGTFLGSSAVYSSCSVDVGGTESYHVTLVALAGGISVTVDGGSSDKFSPSVPVQEVGIWDGATRYVEEMGPDYSGTCADMELLDTNISPSDGQVYCGVLGVTTGELVYLRAEWNATAAKLEDGKVWWLGDNAPEWINPPTPVPMLSPYLLALMTCMLALMGALKPAARGRLSRGKTKDVRQLHNP